MHHRRLARHASHVTRIRRERIVARYDARVAEQLELHEWERDVDPMMRRVRTRRVKRVVERILAQQAQHCCACGRWIGAFVKEFVRPDWRGPVRCMACVVDHIADMNPGARIRRVRKGRWMPW